MYQIKKIGLGKKVCNSDGVTHLYPTLSQKKLKRLFTLKCEFIEYVEQQEGKAQKSEQSTNDKREYPTSGKQTESAKDNSTSTTRRKQNSRKRAKKS